MVVIDNSVKLWETTTACNLGLWLYVYIQMFGEFEGKEHEYTNFMSYIVLLYCDIKCKLIPFFFIKNP
jgi:hypothetical protein